MYAFMLLIGYLGERSYDSFRYWFNCRLWCIFRFSSPTAWKNYYFNQPLKVAFRWPIPKNPLPYQPGCAVANCQSEASPLPGLPVFNISLDKTAKDSMLPVFWNAYACIFHKKLQKRTAV